MTISNTTFVQGITSYLRDYPEAIDAQTRDTLTALAQTTFENAEEASWALAEFVERVQQSDKPGLKKIVQALFKQEIERLISAPDAKEHIEKRPLHETGNIEIGIQDLSLDPLAYIFSFLDTQSKRQAAQACRDFRGAIRLQRIFDCDPLNSPAFTPLISLFGITLPPPNPSSAEVSAAYKVLLAKISYILKGVKTSPVLSDDEKKTFRTMSAWKIVQDPSRLYTLLHTAYEISLVAPFLNGMNHGPKLLKSMTLAEKAEAVRTHLKEAGDKFTELQCGSSVTQWAGRDFKMLCFPTEFCSLQNLQTLYLRDNLLTSIPEQIGQLEKLQVLDLGNNRLTTLPPEIWRLSQLVGLGLSDNLLTIIPAEVGQLAQLQRLYLSGNRLTSISNEIWRLSKLMKLSLSNTNLTTVPAEVGQLAQLQELYLANNGLTTIPAEVGQLAQLQSLDLSRNLITTISPEILRLSRLRRLYLIGNRLTTIPPEIWRFTQEISIFLARNPLTMTPKSTQNIHIFGLQ